MTKNRHRNLRSLAIEMYKVHRGISPKIFNYLFPLRQAGRYNLRKRPQLIIANMKTVNRSFQSLKYLGPKIWETMPLHLKEIHFLKNFKNTIQKWKPISCPSRLWKICIPNIG